MEGQCHPFLPHGKAHYNTRIGECPETACSNNPHPPYTACRALKANVQQGEETPPARGCRVSHSSPQALCWVGGVLFTLPSCKGVGGVNAASAKAPSEGGKENSPSHNTPTTQSRSGCQNPQPCLEGTLSDWLPIPRRLGMGIGSQSELLQELRHSSPTPANSFQVREDGAEGTQKLRAASLPSSCLL